MRMKSDDESTSGTVYVTRPSLPPLGDFLPLLAQIWETRVLTNNGPYAVELERKLTRLFGVAGCSLVNNGMTALLLCAMTLPRNSEVITTPFTFAATAHAISVLGLTPVFCDIEPDHFSLDAAKVESLITPNTSAILAVHTYGYPCDVVALEEVAKRRHLRLFYDASHAFGVTHRGRSLLAYGDASTLSFHATKSFNTFEGGAVVTTMSGLSDEIALFRNFGIRGENDIPSIGINGKMSEFNAALGVVQLAHFDAFRLGRRRVHEWYVEALQAVPQVRIPDIRAYTEHNYSYFPIVLERHSNSTRDEVFDFMSKRGIIARRYFSPLLSNIPPYSKLQSACHSVLPVANDIAPRVLCLPIYPDLDFSTVQRIVRTLRDALSQKM